MYKIAFVFPGQGSQSVGMGKYIYSNYSQAREIIDSLNYDINLLFNGPKKTLQLTQYAQPAIFAVSCAIFSIIKKYCNNFFAKNSKNIAVLGHSLGEYSALFSAEVFGFTDGLKIVNARSKFIKKAININPGVMAAIIGLNETIVIKICEEVSKDKNIVCEAVNFNSTKQVIISGHVEAINKAVYLAKKRGALKTVFLNVSGPFHSSLMSSASKEMAIELKKYEFHSPIYGIYMNYDASLTSNVKSIKYKLIKQVDNPVLWKTSIQNLINTGCNKFIEIGPGRTLSSIIKKIDRSKKVFNTSDLLNLENTMEVINNFHET
ncbi:MAG: ACP S-malonyltransferase [Endomicrobium sp.]|jgi:[acyl-carrier-protein] S-malonyltransferase|nr:ACP S-malonyltransferase [Endomicrobium sp.]